MGFIENAFNNNVLIKVIAVVAALVVLGGLAMVFGKRVSPVGWGWFGAFDAPNGVALAGFDPVSYHQGEPKRGSENHALGWGQASWHFVSEETKALFEADPERFVPRFGGFCAFAVSKGFTAAADPSAYAVHDGGLYVFNSDSIRDQWLEAVDDGVIDQAARKWATRSP